MKALMLVFDLIHYKVETEGIVEEQRKCFVKLRNYKRSQMMTTSVTMAAGRLKSERGCKTKLPDEGALCKDQF